MVSSLLSGRIKPGRPPPICKKGPEPGPWPPDGAPAIQLNAYARWTDLDPIAPYSQAAVFQLARTGPGNIYFGRSNPSDVRLEIRVAQPAPSPYWNITIWTYDPGAPAEDFTWNNVYVDPDKPFDTYLLSDIVEPGFDFRQARVII